jgi:hypothetical protein
MSDPSRALSVRVISCSNVPWGNPTFKNCDPYCRVFQDGAIKCCLGQTPHQSNIADTVDWAKAGQMFLNPVRGLRLYFELFDREQIGADQLLGTGSFDPNIDSPSASGEILIPIVCLQKFKKTRPDEPTILKIAYAFNPCVVQKPPAGRSAPCPSQTSPIYFTVTGQRPLLPPIPFSQSYPDPIKKLVPYRLPYEFAISIFTDASTKVEVVHSGNRYGLGAYHSGLHPCGIDALSQVIRMDPAVVGASGVRSFVLTLASLSYAPLSAVFGNSVTVGLWSSREKPKEYVQAGAPLELGDRQGLTLAWQATVELQGVPSFVALCSGTTTKSKSGFQVDVQVGGEGVPSQKLAQSPRTAGQAMPSLAVALRAAKVQPPETYDFPILLPKTLPPSLGFDPSIRATCKGYKSHYLTAHAFDIKFVPIWNCGLAEGNPAKGVNFRGSEGAIVVELGQLAPEVAVILFTIHGIAPFREEAKIDATKNKFDVVAQQTLTLISTQYKASGRKNGLLWFALSKDGFGGWALTYARVAVNYPEQSDVVVAFGTLIQSILNA